jgi:hypothetical protein
MGGESGALGGERLQLELGATIAKRSLFELEPEFELERMFGMELVLLTSVIGRDVFSAT